LVKMEAAEQVEKLSPCLRRSPRGKKRYLENEF